MILQINTMMYGDLCGVWGPMRCMYGVYVWGPMRCMGLTERVDTRFIHDFFSQVWVVLQQAGGPRGVGALAPSGHVRRSCAWH